MSYHPYKDFNLEFDYFAQNYINFRNDFYKYTDMEVNVTPLTFITDSLLLSMHSRNEHFFAVPGSHCLDRKKHYYFFDKIIDQQEMKIIYRYIRHGWNIFN